MGAVDSNFFATADELVRAVASAWLGELDAVRNIKKPYTVALSGGRIAQRFFSAVVEREGRANDRSSFANVHFFWADERCVPPTDEESNFKLADDLLLRPLGIPPERVHRIHGEETPEKGAEMATAELLQIIPANASGQPVFDLVVLGMGEDGHVASLFPRETDVERANPAIFRPIANSPKPPPNRVTLGFPAIVAAKNAWLLASGAGKKAALDEALSAGGRNPLARVLQGRVQTRIFSDIR